MAHELTIDPNRLFAAADALLEAVTSKAGKDALVEVRLDDPAGPFGYHPSMRGFTPTELTEALTMLMRLGLVIPYAEEPERKPRQRRGC